MFASCHTLTGAFGPVATGRIIAQEDWILKAVLDKHHSIFSNGSLVKNLPAVKEAWVWSLGYEDSLEEEMATHSSILSWKIPGTEESGGLQSSGWQGVEHDWATEHAVAYMFALTHTYTYYIFHSWVASFSLSFVTCICSRALRNKTSLLFVGAFVWQMYFHWTEDSPAYLGYFSGLLCFFTLWNIFKSLQKSTQSISRDPTAKEWL